MQLIKCINLVKIIEGLYTIQLIKCINLYLDILLVMDLTECSKKVLKLAISLFFVSWNQVSSSTSAESQKAPL